MTVYHIFPDTPPYIYFNIFFSIFVNFLPVLFLIAALFRILRDAGDD